MDIGTRLTERDFTSWLLRAFSDGLSAEDREILERISRYLRSEDSADPVAAAVYAAAMSILADAAPYAPIANDVDIRPEDADARSSGRNALLDLLAETLKPADMLQVQDLAWRRLSSPDPLAWSYQIVENAVRRRIQDLAFWVRVPLKAEILSDPADDRSPGAGFVLSTRRSGKCADPAAAGKRCSDGIRGLGVVRSSARSAEHDEQWRG